MALGRAALLVAGLVAGTASLARAAPAATSQPVRASAFTWIFFGVLPVTMETFSGTLVAGPTTSDFELRLADGTTCDGARLDDDTGVVRLHELTCSDGRSMHALFVAKGGADLRVFGRIGEEEFIVDAHLLDLDAPADGAARTSWPPALPPVPVAPVSAP